MPKTIFKLQNIPQLLNHVIYHINIAGNYQNKKAYEDNDRQLVAKVGVLRVLRVLLRRISFERVVGIAAAWRLARCVRVLDARHI